MNDRIPLEIIVFYPRGYKAIIMTLRQNTVIMVLQTGIWRRLPVTFLEHGGKSTPILRAYSYASPCCLAKVTLFESMHLIDIWTYNS